MTTLLPLVFAAAAGSPPPSLSPVAVVALPVAVETAAWAVPVGSELRLWINGPNARETAQLRVLPGRRLEPLPPLPIILAGAASCGGELVVTGSDTRGQPKVLGVATDGRMLWELGIDGPTPILWPVPGCAPLPVIVSQTTPGKIEVAAVGAGGLAERRSLEVGGPPLAIAIGGGATWVVWGDASGIQGVEIGVRGVRAIHIAAPYPGDVAIAPCTEDACVAWLQDRAAFFVRIASDGKPVGPTIPIDLAGASGGRLAIVPGPQPLVWAQRGEALEGEVPRWTSALVLPGAGPPLMVEGLVHAVAWWGEEVVVVGSGELHFLKQGEGE